jgi:secretion/DNA translocation related TadE-like protein
VNPRWIADDDGSGSIAGAAAVVFVAAVLCAVVPLGAALAELETLRGAADASALAAADTASGRVPGVACEQAAAIVHRLGVGMSSCSVSAQGVADVIVSTTILGVPVGVGARAGPPVR